MRVTIIGGGQGGRSILRTLKKMDDINIVGIVDLDDNAPGIQLAKELGINYGKSIQEMLTKEVDLIIEVTGVDKVAEEIKSHNIHNAEIIQSTGAKLMTILVSNEERLSHQLENQMKEISKISHITEDSVKKMHESIDKAMALSNELDEFAERTTQYVKETDQIIQFINRITQQTNILGLNASIEAARAGEQGRGFAIVAKEIQKMAKNSDEFTSKITEILNKINSEVFSIGEEIDQLTVIAQNQSNIGMELETAVSELVASLNED